MSTIGTILKDNWEWRSQIVRIAVFDLKKESRGAALGWLWFYIKPIAYLFCFWFALDVGLRASRTAPGDAPYILWLAAGVIPWMFMTAMLNGGIDVMHRYSYLVKKVKFPLSAISSIYTLSSLFVFLMSLLILVAIYLFCGQPIDIYLLQIPLLIVLMVAFWWFFSVLMSPLCAMSRDVKNLMGTLSTPFFWLSGVIFRLEDVPIDWIHTFLYFNPITFFVTAFRDAVYTKVWIWEDPMLIGGFAAVFVFTAVLALIVYKRTNEEVADVLQ